MYMALSSSNDSIIESLKKEGKQSDIEWTIDHDHLFNKGLKEIRRENRIKQSIRTTSLIHTILF